MKNKFAGFEIPEQNPKLVRNFNDFGEAVRTHDFTAALEYIQYLEAKEEKDHTDEDRIKKTKYLLAAAMAGQKMFDEAEELTNSMYDGAEKQAMLEMIAKKRQEN